MILTKYQEQDSKSPTFPHLSSINRWVMMLFRKNLFWKVAEMDGIACKSMWFFSQGY